MEIYFMKKKFLCVIISIGILIGAGINVSNVVAVQPASEDSTVVENESDIIFRYEWDNQPAAEVKPTPPNVDDIVGNITHYANPEDTVYTGDDIIPSELIPGLEWVNLKIELTAMYVFDDHDLFSPGDIFVRYVPNYWIGDPKYNGWLNYQGRYYDTAEYQIEDGDESWYNFTTPIELYNDWTVLSCMYLNVFDYDDGPDDDLGTIGWWYEDPHLIEGYHEIQTYMEDTEEWGDAVLAFNIEILDTNDVFTAQNITELYQPFLIDNDDTDHTSDPNGLFGRVIHGYDNEIGMGSLCIQYLYYWNEVWTDGFWSDQFIHYDDYELVQIYLNFTYTGDLWAYRFVFDNHDEYITPASDTEWRDSMEYSIYEWGANESEILTKEVYNSEELRPLLGEKYTASYQYRNLSLYYDDLCACYGGVVSMILTVETYNHQFAVGNTGGDLLGQYYIDPYTDDVIQLCYELINDAFTLGTHEINGYTVPDYAPFAYDVLQVFELPYIHSNFDQLMQQAASFQGKTESGGVEINVDRSVNVTLFVPIETTLETSNELIPGEDVLGSLNINIKTDEAILVIDYFFNISVDVDLFFFTKSFGAVFTNSLTIDFSNPIIQMVLEEIGMEDTYEHSMEFLDGMLSVDLEFTPQIIDTILNCTIGVHVDEILKYYFPQYALLVDLFFEDVVFTINPVLTGYIESDLSFGSDIQSIHMEQTSMDIQFEFTVPEVIDEQYLLLELLNFVYGLNFKINWGASIQFAEIISWFFDDIEFDFGTWPNDNYNLTSLGGELEVAKYRDDIDNTRWLLDDTTPVCYFGVDKSTIEEGEEVVFTDQTTWGDAPLSYQWDFGDGSANMTGSTGISHIYQDPGTFTAVLTVSDVDGDASVFSEVITVESSSSTETEDPTDTGDPTGDGFFGFSILVLNFLYLFANYNIFNKSKNT